MKRRWVLIRAVVVLLSPSAAGAQMAGGEAIGGQIIGGRWVVVREVASDTLRDVALTTLENGRYTIYYNPKLLQWFGPRVREFFIAHEYGHIAHGHGVEVPAEPDSTYPMSRQRQELDADCHAAQHLGAKRRETVEAAVDFFMQLSRARFDPFHPTGAQRAAMLIACLPVEVVDPENGPSIDNPSGGPY